MIRLSLLTGLILAFSAVRSIAAPPQAAPPPPAESAASGTSSISTPAHSLIPGVLPYIHEFWTVREGLPVNSVNVIGQTREGYLWLATFDGLVRFDGLQFTVFNRGNSEGLPSNRIIDILEGDDGSLFVTCEGGELARFRDGSFHAFGSEQGLKSPVSVLYKDGGGIIWVGTESGLFQVEGDRVVPCDSGRDAFVSAVYKDRFGTLWIGTRSDGCYRLQGGKSRNLTTADGLLDNWAASFGEDTDGNFWIGTMTGVHRYRNGAIDRAWADPPESRLQINPFLRDERTGTLLFATGLQVFAIRNGEPVEIAPGQTGSCRNRSMVVDPQGHIWLGLDKKLFRDDRFIFEAPEFITGLLIDREGNLWVGTMGGGLHRFRESPFQTWSVPEGLSGKNVYTVCETRDGALWVGMFGTGFSRLRNGTFTNFRPPDFPSHVVSLCQARDGRLWVGCLGGAGTFEHGHYVPRLETYLGRSRRVSAILEDSKGTLWFGTVGEIIGLRDGEWLRFPAVGSERVHVRAIAESKDGSIWFGTSGPGLFRLRGNDMEHLEHAGGTPIEQVRSIYQDEDGVIWIGTEGLGLLRVALPEGRPLAEAVVTPFRKSDGLFDDVIHRIMEDDQRRLWMSTNRGIFRVERASLDDFAAGRRSRIHCVSYTDREGLRNPEANGGFQPAGARGRDGRLWFPTQDGIVAIDPARMGQEQALPGVVVEKFSTRKRSPGVPSGVVKLSSGERDFEIAYTVPTFIGPQNTLFRYRLDGFNRDWVDAGNRRVAYYTNVPPGRYTFRVASSPASDFSDNTVETSFSITVAPRFHETRTFWAGVFLLLAGGTVSGYRWRMRRAREREMGLASLVEERTRDLRDEQRKLEAARIDADAQRREAERLKTVAEEALDVTRTQAAHLKELDEVKSRFFANISHEFRTPLTLIVGPVEDVMNGMHGPLAAEAKAELDQALKNAWRLLNLINQMLDLSKLEAGQRKLKAREGDLVAYIVRLAQSFASLAQRKKITLQVRPFDAPVSVYHDPELMENVFLNLLSNAFKFTPDGGLIQVSMDVDRGSEPGNFVVTVRDNGPGIPREDLPRVFDRFHQAGHYRRGEAAGTGIGLSLAREVVHLHGGTISVESEFGFGAAFTVRLPLGAAGIAPDQVVMESPAIEASRSEPGIDDEFQPVPDSDPPVDGDSDDPDRTAILIVDDNPEIRSFLRKHLEDVYRVIEARDGEEGLAAVRRDMPDLVISDVMMPAMDGYAFCRAVREDPEISFIPFILLTARSSEDSRMHGLELGADDFLTKPFNRRELRLRVRNMIESRRRLRAQSPAVPAPGPRSLPDDVISSDQMFLNRVYSVIESHLEDEAFSVHALAREVGLDRTQLFRKLRALVGMPPTDLIRSARLERAARLLEGGAGTVSEIAYGVGFKSVSHFSASFRERYGMTPSAYASRRTTS